MTRRLQVATRGRRFNFRSRSRPSPVDSEDTNQKEKSTAAHSKSPSKASSSKASTSSQLPSMSSEDPPTCELAQGPLWGFWLLWDKSLKVSHERLSTAKSVEISAQTYFDSMAAYNSNFTPPNEFDLVYIVQIDRTCLPKLLKLKVINSPIKKELIPLNKLWTIHAYDELGSILSLLLKERTFLMVSGPRFPSQKLIVLNSRDINKFSQIFLNLNYAFPERVDLFMNNLNKIARLQTSIHFGPGGESVPNLIHIVPYFNTKRSSLTVISRVDPIPSKSVPQPSKKGSEVRALFQTPQRVPESLANKGSPKNNDSGTVRDRVSSPKSKKDNEGGSKREEESDIHEGILHPSDIIEEVEDESQMEVENDENTREIERNEASDDDKSVVTSPHASGLRSSRGRLTVEKNNVKIYEKLGDLKAQLDEVAHNSDRKMLRDQRYAYGIVQAVLEPKDADPPGTYRVRIFDETYDGVLLRIHEPGRNKGVRPSVDEIIRVHRICVQLEKDGDNLAMVLSLPNHRSYVLFDPRLENIDGPILRQTLANNYSVYEEDERRIRELRRYLKVRKDTLKRVAMPGTPTKSILRSTDCISVSNSPVKRTSPRKTPKKSGKVPESQDISPTRSLRSRSASVSPKKGYKELDGTPPPPSPKKSVRFEYPDELSDHSMRTAVTTLSSDEEEEVVEEPKSPKKKARVENDQTSPQKSGLSPGKRKK